MKPTEEHDYTEAAMKTIKAVFIVLAILIPILGIATIHNFASGIWDRLDGQIARTDAGR